MAGPTLFPEGGFRRLRIDLAYDGSDFYGWAAQPDQRTLQDMIEAAISKICQSPVTSVVAGRTDAGVHATGQVIHVDLLDSIFASSQSEALTYSDLRFRLNRILDEDVRILDISDAPEGFHARFSALRRFYSYKILDSNRVVTPLARYDTVSWYRELDPELLNQASAQLLGHHDFAAFCKFKEGGTTIRTLEKYQWQRGADGLLIAHVVADAFCYSMVRNLVGAVVSVADGRKDGSWLAELLANKERVSDSLVFPAKGLTLYRVEYPSNSQLIERAKVTIGKRSPEL